MLIASMNLVYLQRKSCCHYNNPFVIRARIRTIHARFFFYPTIYATLKLTVQQKLNRILWKGVPEIETLFNCQ